jgi:hypothetical protein
VESSLVLASAINHPNAQSSSGFEKRNFSYNEWTKGKFSEVVTVTNPGKFIFLAGIGPEREAMAKLFMRAILWSNADMLT